MKLHLLKYKFSKRLNDSSKIQNRGKYVAFLIIWQTRLRIGFVEYLKIIL